MDQNFYTRLKAVREQRGYASARSFSLALGLNPNSWAVYETGTNLPGAAVFNALHKQGVNLNWVVSGEGEMLRDGFVAATDVPKPLPHTAHSNSLEQPLLFASGASNLQERLTVYQFLAGKHPMGVAVKVIADSTKLKQDEVQAIIAEMVLNGHAECVSTVDEIYAATSSIFGLNANNVPDRANAVLESVRFVLNTFMGQSKSKSVLIDGKSKVVDASDFVNQLCFFMREYGDRNHKIDGQSVRIVLAATIEGDS